MSIEDIINVLGRLADGAEACAIAPREPEAERKKHERSAESIREAIARLRTHPEGQPNEPQGGGWISVEDKDNPPPKAEKVIAYLKLSGGDIIDTAYYMGEDGWYYTGWEAPHHGVVTHWRPLPNPPKED